MIEKAMISLGISNAYHRPMYWFRKMPPFWYSEGLEYDAKKHDPLAATYISVTENETEITSGYRCTKSDIMVSPENMVILLTALKNYKSPTNPAKGS